MYVSRKKITIVIILILLFTITFFQQVYAVSDLEKKLARKQYQIFKKKVGFVKLNPNTERRLNRIVNDLNIETKKDNPDLIFKLHILDADVMNAVYIGNGQIMVFKGLFNKLDTDSQIASVIGHEMGHGIGNDIQEQINLSQGLQLVNILIGQVDDKSGSNLENLIMNLFEKGFSRTQEKEADNYATHLLEETKYDPKAMISLLNILKKDSSNPGNLKLLELFQTHPYLSTRISYTKKLIEKIEKANKLYYSPVATTKIFTESLINNKVDKMYSTYTEQFQSKFTLNQFKSDPHLKSIRMKINNFKPKHRLWYDINLRNSREGTARVAIIFYKNKKQIFALAIDLIKTQYGWRMLKIPMFY